MLTRRRFSRASRLLLLCITIIVFFVYKLRKSSSKSLEVENFTHKTASYYQYSNISASTNFQFSIQKHSQLNPFRETATNINQIMMAYSNNNFNIPPKRRLKKILFWNEAYGSKDYGKCS